MSEKYYKCTRENGKAGLCGRTFFYPLPTVNKDGTVKPGKRTRKCRGMLQLCKCGYHLTDREHISSWISDEIYEAEYFGARLVGSRKICCEQVRLVRQLDWSFQKKMKFAILITKVRIMCLVYQYGDKESYAHAAKILSKCTISSLDDMLIESEKIASSSARSVVQGLYYFLRTGCINYYKFYCETIRSISSITTVKFGEYVGRQRLFDILNIRLLAILGE